MKKKIRLWVYLIFAFAWYALNLFAQEPRKSTSPGAYGDATPPAIPLASGPPSGYNPLAPKECSAISPERYQEILAQATKRKAESGLPSELEALPSMNLSKEEAELFKKQYTGIQDGAKKYVPMLTNWRTIDKTIPGFSKKRLSTAISMSGPECIGQEKWDKIREEAVYAMVDQKPSAETSKSGDGLVDAKVVLNKGERTTGSTR